MNVKNKSLHLKSGLLFDFSIYFFLPFFIITGFGIYQDSFAEIVVIGYDYFDTVNPDGSHTWKNHYPYIQNQNNEWVPFLNDGNKVETNFGSVILNADGTYSFYKKGIINEAPLFTDKIIAKYADISDLNSWTYPNTINNDIPDISWNGSSFVSTKINNSIGKLEYKYVLSNGVWKTQLEATNLSSLTSKVFGFDQIIDLNRDTIKFGGQERNLDSFNGVTFNKQWLTDNKSKVINFLNDISFDFDKGFENLYSVTVYDIGINSSRLVFDYRTSIVLLPNETLIIDPVYSSNNPTVDGHIWDNDGNDSCNATPGAYGDTTIATTLDVGSLDTGAGADCFRGYLEFDITSISDTATITDVDFLFDVDSVSASPIAPDVRHMANQPSVTAVATIWSDIADGTVYLTAESTFTTTGDNKSVDLGTSADTDLQSALTNNWFAIGLKGNTEPVGASERKIVLSSEDSGTATPKPTLEITYTLPVPSAPLNPSALTQSTSSILFDWDIPTNGDNITGYKIWNATDTSVILNDTGSATTSYTLTGLKSGTLQQLIVSAWNATGIGANSTTVSNHTINTPPVLDNVNSYNSTAFEIFYTINGTFNGIKVEIDELPYSSFSTLISNSSSSSASLVFNGITNAVDTAVKIFAHNWGGTSIESNQIINATNSTSAPVLASVSQTLLTSTLDLVITPPVNGTTTTYNIFRSPSGCDSLISVGNSSVVTYTSTGMIVATEYCFQVYSVNAYGLSIGSNLVNQTTISADFLGGGGSSGGGNSGILLPTSVSNALLLNLGSKTIQHSLGEKRTYSLELLWDKTKEFSLIINSIKIGQGGFDSLSIVPELLPLAGKKIVDGKGEIFLTVDAPGEKCEQIQITARCVYVKTYTIPVTVSVTDILGTSYPDIPAVLTISIIEKFPIGLAIVVILLLAVSYPIAKIISQNSKKSGRKSPKQMQKDHQKALKKSEKMERKQAKHDMNIFKKIKKEF